MPFSIRRMRRNGAVLPQREIWNSLVVVGELRIEEMQDSLLRRTIRVARLADSGNVLQPDLLPALIDPVLLWGANDVLVLGGMERQENAETRSEHSRRANTVVTLVHA